MPLKILLDFKCTTCNYTEPIGVDVRTGLILRGSLTVICPNCGNLYDYTNALLMTPVQFIRPPGIPK